jgi:phage N-6-adenine-methyltransferase
MADWEPLSMNMHLTRYEAARAALAEAHRVDEVKEVRNIAVALELYAKQANDTELLKQCTEIRLRAERRWGELYGAMPKAKGAEGNPGGQGAPIVRSPVETAQSPTLAELGVTKTQSAKWQKLAALPEEQFEIRVAHAKARVEGMTTSAPPYHKAFFTGENEWFTPDEYLDAARRVLGGIDLDPASHPLAQERIKACRFFTAAENGLAHPWPGRVWLNPPYARGLIDAFVLKLVDEVWAGRVTAAILLTHNYTDTGWFHAAANAAQAFCLLSGRVHFIAPSGDECSPTQGQVFFYFGADVVRFAEVFGRLGAIAGLWKPGRAAWGNETKTAAE